MVRLRQYLPIYWLGFLCEEELAHPFLSSSLPAVCPTIRAAGHPPGFTVCGLPDLYFIQWVLIRRCHSLSPHCRWLDWAGGSPSSWCLCPLCTHFLTVWSRVEIRDPTLTSDIPLQCSSSLCWQMVFRNQDLALNVLLLMAL